MDLNTDLILSADLQILLDYEHNAFGWRLERQGRSWLDRTLAPLSAEEIRLLLSFQRGAKVADVLRALNGKGPVAAGDAVERIERWLDLGFLHRAGEDPKRPDHRFLPLDLEEGFRDIYDRVRDFTLTSVEKMYALYNACEYVAGAGIPGDFAESGVWRGGSMMLCAHALQRLEDSSRKLFLFDTYSGMPEPCEKDVFFDGKTKLPKGSLAISLEEVQKNVLSTGYPRDNIVFVKGMVEETLPRFAPERLALLRVDTDFYESTYHALVHLFPRLSAGGVLVLDDYGALKGAREAVARYLKETNAKMLLTRVERGAIGVKTQP